MKFQFSSILFLSGLMVMNAATDLDDSCMMLETRLRPLPAYIPWLIGLGIILVLGVVIGVLWWLHRKHAAQQAIPPTPYEVASSALQALLSEGLPERGESKQFHQRLSGILRQYLEERFGVSAPRLTTEEFLHYLSETPEMVKEHRLLLQTFLQACDMVKFAAATPMPADMQSLAGSCRTFLDRTKEAPQSEAQEGTK